MARYVLMALYAVTVLGAEVKAEMSMLDLGMTMTTRAYDAACWYENLKKFPQTDSKQFMKCMGQAKAVQELIQNPNEQNQKYFDFYGPEKKEEKYAEWLTDNAMGSIPSDYADKCASFFKAPKAEPTSEESDALNDNNSALKYPFKGLAYCMVKVLRDKHGDGAIDAVKSEMTHENKNWMSTLLERDNEFRARHGSAPLQVVKELNTAAQEWADVNAKECKMYHTKNEDPRRQFRGKGTGESIASGGGEDNNRNAAYIASDGWYEENKDYPYPEYKKADDPDGSKFEKIGHFTQTVWKGSKYVGYGYAYNKDCDEMKFYIAARYYPAGNGEGEFGANVAPPKE